MGDISLIAVDHDLQRSFYGANLDHLTDWPEALPIDSKNYGLFLACDATEISHEDILILARKAMGQGLAYLCAWGPDCERVHDLFDQVIVDRNPDPTDTSVVMTTWHDNETLDEALFFFAFAAFPADDYAEACQSWIAVTLRSPEWSAQIHKRLADPKALSAEVGGVDDE